MQLIPIIVSIATLCYYASGSQVKSCDSGRALEDTNQVSLSNCDKPPCRLRRKTSVTIELKFKPQTEVESIKNSVHATILGIPFPFIGVDGASVCDKLFDAGTGAKANCPLKEGREYVYRDEFKILEIYPKLKLVVHWALKDQDDEDVMCFEVPAKIT